MTWKKAFFCWIVPSATVLFESDGVGGRGGFGSTVLTVRQLVCFGVDQGAGPRKKSTPVFAFNMIGASCATLHSKPGDSVAF